MKLRLSFYSIDEKPPEPRTYVRAVPVVQPEIVSLALGDKPHMAICVDAYGRIYVWTKNGSVQVGLYDAETGYVRIPQ